MVKTYRGVCDVCKQGSFALRKRSGRALCPTCWPSHITPRTEGFARSLVAHSTLVDVPQPDEPGVRVVGFAYIEAQASMVEALSALQIIRDAFRKT